MTGCNVVETDANKLESETLSCLLSKVESERWQLGQSSFSFQLRLECERRGLSTVNCRAPIISLTALRRRLVWCFFKRFSCEGMRSINGFDVIPLSFFIVFSFLLLQFVLAADTLVPGKSISGDETLISVGGNFVLGFFRPGVSQNRYVGIWYKQVSIKTFVWVANRETPVIDSSGVLKIGNDGNLVILDGRNRTIWSTNSSASASSSTAKLMDSGNLVLIADGDYENPLWQSFDYPSDTLLPGMKLGLDLKTGLNRFLTSWKDVDDPTPGNYVFKMDPHGSPQIYLRSYSTPIYRSGPWNGQRFSGVPEMKPSYVFTFSFVNNKDEIYYSFSPIIDNVISRLVLNQSGTLQRFTWIDNIHIWNLFWLAPKDQCDDYGECGVYGLCNTNDSPVCSCLQGFEPKNPQAWYLRDGSSGCVRKTELKCASGDGFLKLKGMKLPDTSSAQVDGSLSTEECRAKCFENCSCTAYANSDINGGGMGCVIWTGDLMDLRQYPDSGQDLYVRLDASDLGESKGRKRYLLVIVLVPTFLGFILMGSTIYCLWRRKKEKDPVNEEKSQNMLLSGAAATRAGANGLSAETTLAEARKEEPDLPLFELGFLVAATCNFSDENKIGEGGFGPVYKGLYPDGREIAVKRLCTRSGQGVREFKNEVRLISKLQHRNLVRLLGCCIEREEKILIYEYMSNKSLDFFLFDQTRSAMLDWRKRFHIIAGIARGLLYLHEDSRLRIIHRDLKASNVLLDGDMNPKISDFGMARIFGGNQTQENTIKVVGTYGYMSPEYAMDGLFSMKSDVFSYGVLLLEIVSGKKNRSFLNSDHSVNLLGYAWQLWKEERGLDLMDPSMGDSCCAGEVLRCIQVGLLCVQDIAADRPTMSSVVFMLGTETPTMPAPKQPTFFTGRAMTETDSSSSRVQTDHTINDVTLTTIDAR